MAQRLRATAVLATLTIAGCAGDTIKEKMNSYRGQPISAVIARLGFPTTEQTIAGSKVYIWSTSHLVEGTSYGCKIRAIVDRAETITTWDFEGNEGGCTGYASKLR